MPKREAPKKASTQLKRPSLPLPGFLKNAFRDPKFLFVFGCVIALLAAMGIPKSPNKLTLVLGIPLVAELGVLGVGNTIIMWIYKTSVFRGLITSIFGIDTGILLALWGDAALIGGVTVIILSILLMIRVLWKFVKTRDLGYRTQDPVQTLGMAAFLTGLLVLAAGEFTLFVCLVLASLQLLIYKGFASTIIITGLTAGIVETIFGNIVYTGIILFTGISSLILGFVARHKDAVKARLATVKQE